jgi:FMN reductase [NAD(P)H]
MSKNEMPDHHGPIDGQEGKYPNETMRLLLERGSLRNFSDTKIPPETLQQILDAGNRAATGGNLQPYSIIKIEDDAVREKLAEWCGQNFIAKAPVNLLFCIDWWRNERWAALEVAPFSAKNAFRHFWISIQDTVIAAQNICTAADAMGLGSVYIGTVLEIFRELKDLFELPDGVFPVVLLCIGYPRNRITQRKKLGVDVLVHDEKYRKLGDQELLDAFGRKYEGQKVKINDERLEAIEQVCREVHGEEFAQKCLERIKQTGYINPIQRYFGLHYVANEMPGRNQEYLQIMEDFGFGWFKEFKKKV